MQKAFLAGCLFISTVISAQWVKTNGPEGMSIVVFHKHNNILFAGTEAKGVYKSINDGQSWSSANTALTSDQWVLSMESDAGYLYLGVLGSGVYRSADNGVSWQPANNGIQTYAVNCLLSAGGYLFAGTIGHGIYRSADHGTTWININQNLFTYSYIHSMVCQNNRLIIEADNYLFFSLDYGITWDVDQGITAFYVIKDFFHHGDTLLASAFGAVFRSTDGGVNWDGPVYPGNNLVGFDNIGDTIYAGHKYGVYRSVDWGLTWTEIPSTGLRWGERGENTFKISGNRMLIGIDHIGIYSSTDKGLTWSQCNLFDFPRASTSDDAMIYHNGTIYAGTHSDGVYKTTDQGNSWSKIGTPNNQDSLSNSIIFSMLHLDPDIILAGACGKGLYRSADNGATWTHITAGLPTEGPYNFTCIKSLAKCGTNILAALTAGMYYSTDMGLTWQPTNLVGSHILQTGGLAVRNNVACTGVSGFPSIDYTGIYRSTDYGVNWTRVTGTLDIEFMKEGGNTTMYAGSLFSSYVSHNDGLTWYNLPGLGGAFTILAWDNYALIGNNYGVAFSQDNGYTWMYRNEGLDPYPNNAVQGFTKDNVYVYAGLSHDAVWRRPISNLILGPLPITLTDLGVEYRDGVAILKWKTLTESKTSRFDVERGFNGTEFNKIGQVNAVGNSTSAQQYKFEDSAPLNGINFYRLKIIDIDGKFSYSIIVSIRIDNQEKSFTVYPNPVSGKTISIHLDNLVRGAYRIDLFAPSGQLVYKKNIIYEGGSLSETLILPSTLSKGLYNLRLSSGETTYQQKVLIRE
jgi:photosystem II stability/assembly factor-like uncharacterized protein